VHETGDASPCCAGSSGYQSNDERWIVAGEFVDNGVGTSRKPWPQFDHMIVLVDAGEVNIRNWSRLESDR
jgi:hypothetical protein